MYLVMMINISLSHAGVILGSIVPACQIEVVVVATATGLIAHFVTKSCVKQNPILCKDRSGKTAETGPERSDNIPLYESAGHGGFINEHVEMQPSPAYQATPKAEFF